MINQIHGQRTGQFKKRPAKFFWTKPEYSWHKFVSTLQSLWISHLSILMGKRVVSVSWVGLLGLWPRWLCSPTLLFYQTPYTTISKNTSGHLFYIAQRHQISFRHIQSYLNWIIDPLISPVGMNYPKNAKYITPILAMRRVRARKIHSKLSDLGLAHIIPSQMIGLEISTTLIIAVTRRKPPSTSGWKKNIDFILPWKLQQDPNGICECSVWYTL